MAENGSMVLDEMVYDPGTQEGSVSLSVIQGVFTFVSGEIAKTDPDAMTLDTPVATIGIRGTQLAMSFDPDDAGGDGLNVVLMEEADGFVGEVVVQNGGGVQILNVADMGTSVASANAAPSTPVQFDRGDIVNAFGGALKSLPDSVSGSTYGAEEAAAEDTVEEETAEETAGEEELAEEESGEEGADEEELAEELEEELAEEEAEEEFEEELAEEEGEEEEITEEELAESLDEEFETAAGGDDADLGDDGEFSVTDTAAAEEAAAAQAAADAAAEAAAAQAAAAEAAAQAAAEAAAAATEAAAQAAADAAAQAAADASAAAAAQAAAAAAAAQAAAEAAAVEALRQATANEPELTVGPASGDEDQEGGIPLDISVTSTDPVGNETLSVTISGLPEGGTLSAGTDNGDGTWTLTEADLSGLTLITAENYNGDVALSVTATSTVSDREDGNSASTSDTIEVSVAAVNDAAIIGGTDSDTLTEGDVGDEPLTASGELTITDVDVGESVFQAQTDTVGSYGNFSVGTGGEWTYDLDPTAADWLTDGLVVTETFEVLSADGTSTTVTVTITGTDDAPVIGGTTSDTLTETDAAQQATGQLTITDADAGESVFQAQTDTAGSYGNFSVGTGGDWTFDLDPTTADALTDGQEVTETFDVLSADGTSTTVTVTITGTNDAPVIGGTSSDSLTETDAAQQASGQLTITDVDAGEDVFQAQTDTAGSYGDFTIGTGG
ncbi:MAG TPA: VCBS domain-containing protein, partial [Rhodospirillales bacterium]|nr:VCBS domain-containing protein [Rhodospirillales bacterium]